MNTKSSINEIKGIGSRTAALYEKLDIFTVEDLLNHFPKSYETYHAPVCAASAPIGEISALRLTLKKSPSIKNGAKAKVILALATDGSGDVELVFFNQPFLAKTLKTGKWYVFRGQVSAVHKKDGTCLKKMEQPKIFAEEEYQNLMQTLMPVYPLTKGLSGKAISKAVARALEDCTFPEEIFPENVIQEFGLLPYKQAYEAIHFPALLEDAAAARRRFVFTEFFTFFYYLMENQALSKNLPNDFPMFETADTVRYVEHLPYALTKAQKKVWRDIRNDLSSPYAMNRLIQGDVGSGKTILAFLALLETAANGYQGALMAPTEVLARQHFENLCKDIKAYDLAFRPVLLVGAMSAKAKGRAYEKIASGEANVIIGTHALIQEKVAYKNLGLVITDEQHRFGVRQRERLQEKNKKNPHVLVMSATPIPRSLAIVLYGDLDVSIIDELPKNRLPIKNCVVNTAWRNKAYAFIKTQVEEGRQAYVICPMIEATEDEALENVMDYTLKLREALPTEIQVTYLHGRMQPAEKQRIMDAFAKGEIHVLVSTTVIEVGINVPNATVMLVENAERFGLAALHQLRGRVGRGEAQSYCIFISTNEKPETKERLDILNKSNDGFEIAAKDLQLRGPGDLFGLRQSGAFDFKVGDIYTDAALLMQVRDAVEGLLKADPALERQENQNLKAYLSLQQNSIVDFRSI